MKLPILIAGAWTLGAFLTFGFFVVFAENPVNVGRRIVYWPIYLLGWIIRHFGLAVWETIRHG